MQTTLITNSLTLSSLGKGGGGVVDSTPKEIFLAITPTRLGEY